MLSIHPERAPLALSASFSYSRRDLHMWDDKARILPKLSSLKRLEIGVGLGHPDPFGKDYYWALSEHAMFPEFYKKWDLSWLFQRCDSLHSLRTVVLLESHIRIQEAWAIF
jgi:hypothetical protein